MHVSILFLMSMPFLISGSIFGAIYMAHLRAQGQRWPSFFTKCRARLIGGHFTARPHRR
jgi:hypothetical protein